MKLVLVGDFHIPSRAGKVPDWIISVISSEKPDVILCTGDLESEDVLKQLEELAPTLCVRGNMDWLDLPMHETKDVGNFRVGLIHGHGIHPRGDPDQLYWYAEKMNVNILVSGHTHKMTHFVYKGILFVNPGTATGVWGGATDGEPETFILMVINGNKITIKEYSSGNLVEVVCYEYTGEDFVKC